MLKLLFCLGLVVGAWSVPPVSRSRGDIEKFRDFLESTRKPNGVMLSSRSAANPQANVWENSGKYQGDILLDDHEVEAMVSQYAQGRNAYIWPNTKWPQNTIVYEFSSELNFAQRLAVWSSIREIERKTCIRFRTRRPDEFNYVLVTGAPDGCYANVGYWPLRGVHTFNLALDTPGRGCFHPVVIIHEWLHIIGFFHMQSTYNRDDYVRIHLENIWPGMEHNFDRYEPIMVSNLGFPYEYTSCMHYSSHAFSINGMPTITALRSHTGIMGQLEHVTDLDWQRVNRHYECTA